MSGSQLCPLVVACDEAYAMPLATLLLSIAEGHRAHWPLSVVVVHDGYSANVKHQVLQSVPAGSLLVQWLEIDLAAFRSFALLPHVSAMTYARLLLPQLLPPDCQRVLYLDTDMLVLGDLTPLMRTDLQGQPVAAIEDFHARADRVAGRLQPDSLLATVKHYFNAGVLLLDLQACREHAHFMRAIDFLHAHPQTPYGDQDALNAALDGQWLAVDRRWNFQNHHVNRLDRMPVAERPAVAHFITSSKPWNPTRTSINAALYNSFRDRTGFRRSAAQRLRDWLVTTACRVKNQASRTRLWLAGQPTRTSAGTPPLPVAAKEPGGD
jgi:lipopolysaccharide biosynthesis glycosyltransferase